MRWWVVLFTLLYIWGCASTPVQSRFEVGGLIIRNETSGHLDSVEIRVNQGVAKCGFIPSQGFCSTTFPRRTYNGLPATITWTSAGNSWVRENVIFKALDDGRQEEVANVEILILPGGLVSHSVVR